jgi:uridine monophosphate synthetase
MKTNTTLIHSLYQIGAVQFGEFKLKSGMMSPIYINLRKIISYPNLLKQVADAIWDKASSTSSNLICGVPYTALPIATCLSLAHQLPMVMRRKEKKEYGTKQLIEGDFKAHQTCLVIEDIITTGGSILETCVDLEDAGLKINQVVALVDREQGGMANLTKKYHAQAVLTLSEILTTLLSSNELPANEKLIVEKLLSEKATLC